MTPSEIKPGMKFGKWTVLKYDHTNNHRIKYYLCRCVCGTEKPVRGCDLISGKSSGCCKRCKEIPIGQRFGKYTVVGYDKDDKRKVICQCDCGSKKSVDIYGLLDGRVKSCGCLKDENTTKRWAKKRNEYIGQKFGRLTVTGVELRERKNGEETYFNCDCDCGNKITVYAHNVLTGNTISCGCINLKANEIMDKILTKHNIPFEREYRIPDCKDKNPLPFDFAIFDREHNLIGLIENNGTVHYSCAGTGWNTKDRLIYCQKHDYIKRKYCEDHRIPFLIIPYQYFNEIEKFLVTSDFWKIITKNFND